MRRRTALKLIGAAGALGLGATPGAANEYGRDRRNTDKQRLVIQNRTDEVCRTEVLVDGEVSLPGGRSHAGRDSAVDGRIISITDPHGTDRFDIDGEIRRIRWDCDEPPRITLDGHRIDPRDYDGDHDDDDDDDDDHDGRRPSRLVLTSRDDDARFRVRFTGRSIGRRGTRTETYGPNETISTRVRGRTEFRYAGRLALLELQGAVDVDVRQRTGDEDDWWDDWWY
ncbi:hypothetical protein [Haloarchaeobius baliensis]|uniref:hypothetical protein n=1 Tax=Haloarchaeobius baliensis TaxID=1670458 RepID=UPI003F880B0B